MMVFHTVYKTTNLVNGRYYFGYHKTRKPQDSYLGSGLVLRNAISKYGAGSFCKEILFTYLDAESAFGKEHELVEVFRLDPLCMNIREGGSGGFDWINKNGLNPSITTEGRERIRQSKLGKKRPVTVGKAVAKANQGRTGWSHPQEVRDRIAESNRVAKALNPPKGWNKGLKSSEETRRKISEKASLRKGELNPSFGKVCMRNPVTGVKRRVPPEEQDLLLSAGWLIGFGERGRK